MDTPSNIATVVTSDSGLTPGTILKRCDDAQNGVSVENVLAEKEGHQWYVFRASYGREDKAAQLLASLNATTYIARHTVYFKTKGGVKSTIKKLIPNMVFAYLTQRESEQFVKGHIAPAYRPSDEEKQTGKHIQQLSTIISYYYNHFAANAFGKNPPLVVPFQQMKDFIIATSTEQDVMPIDERDFEIGEEVEVVKGEFTGLHGKVIRKPRNRKLYVQLHQAPVPHPEQGPTQRLAFQVPCLGSFCSALIPTAYFRKLE